MLYFGRVDSNPEQTLATSTTTSSTTTESVVSTATLTPNKTRQRGCAIATLSLVTKYI